MKQRFVFLIVFALAWSALSVNASTGRNRFGIVEGFWFPEMTCDLGVGWERIIFDWSQHQPEGPDDWYTLNVDDRWLKAADACDREVVALLKNTPTWATDGIPGAGVPRGLDLPVHDPENVWANFVRRAADYYASRGVNRFIIWNEPDILAGTFGYEFEGSLEDYARLLQVAYLAAKEANPAAQIHLAGTTYWHDVNAGRTPYMQRLVEYLQTIPNAGEHGYFFDVLSLHIYFRTDSVYDIVTEMRTMLDDHGMGDKSIWINEMNAAPTDDPGWPVERPQFPLNLAHQAAYVVQAAALGMAAGADHIAVYKLYDQALPEGGESFGLLNPRTREPRPAFHAWRGVTQRMASVETVRLSRTDGVTVVHLTHNNDQQTLVLWARTEMPVRLQVDALADKAYVMDHLANQTILRPVEGRYTLDLSGALCDETEGCYIGGPPLLLTLPAGEMAVHQDGVPLVFSEETTLE